MVKFDKDNTLILHIDVMPSESMAGENDEGINLSAVWVEQEQFGNQIGQYKDTIGLKERRLKVRKIIESVKRGELNMFVFSSMCNPETFNNIGKIHFEDMLQKNLVSLNGKKCTFIYNGSPNKIKLAYARKLAAISYLLSSPYILGPAISACIPNGYNKVVFCLDTLPGDQPDLVKRKLNQSIEFVKHCLDHNGLKKGLDYWSKDESLPEIHVGYCADGKLSAKESKLGGAPSIVDYVTQSLYASLNPESWLSLGKYRTENDRVAIADLIFELGKMEKVYVEGKPIEIHYS